VLLTEAQNRTTQQIAELAAQADRRQAEAEKRQAETNRQMAELNRQLDERINKLVVAIGEFLRRGDRL